MKGLCTVIQMDIQKADLSLSLKTHYLAFFTNFYTTMPKELFKKMVFQALLLFPDKTQDIMSISSLTPVAE